MLLVDHVENVNLHRTHLQHMAQQASENVVEVANTKTSNSWMYSGTLDHIDTKNIKNISQTCLDNTHLLVHLDAQLANLKEHRKCKL